MPFPRIPAILKINYLINMKESKKSERILDSSSLDFHKSKALILDLPDCCFSIWIIWKLSFICLIFVLLGLLVLYLFYLSYFYFLSYCLTCFTCRTCLTSLILKKFALVFWHSLLALLFCLVLIIIKS
jgi:hypothetical protein